MFFRFILRVPRRFDAVHHDVPLVYAQLFHGALVHAAAAAESEKDGGEMVKEYFPETNSHKILM